MDRLPEKITENPGNQVNIKVNITVNIKVNMSQ